MDRRFRPMRAAAALLVIATAAPATAAAQAASDHAAPSFIAADVDFMTGMISHHAQAVVMAGWASSHGAGASVQALCDRIVVGQRDEIAFMRRWLGERHLSVPPADGQGGMPGMDHPMLMPGMLTPDQLARLDSARGPEFDRRFLTLMIQHHRGALTMVRTLLDTPGAARDGVLFQFASDVSADQATEIDRMTRMLLAPSQPLQRSPQ